MTEPYIRVGLITDGKPRTITHDDYTEVGNLLIGDGFHWRKPIVARFSGRIEMLDTPQGNIHAVNVLPLESYLESVTASEMNPHAHPEFLKAHAVISRSWALRKLRYRSEARQGSRGTQNTSGRIITWEESDSHDGFDVCSDDHCQRYQGLPQPFESCRGPYKAVADTRGEVLTHGFFREIADARFSKCCGGVTERFSSCWADTDRPYLPVREDPWCDLDRSLHSEFRTLFLDRVLKTYDSATTFFEWTESLSKSEIAENLRERHGIHIGNILHLNPVRRGGSGRIVELEIIGSEGRVTIGKELEIRRVLSRRCLRSSWIEVTGESDDAFEVRGRGWGHGAGLCQIGAAVMAAEGKDYREILDFYYPGTKISKMY